MDSGFSLFRIFQPEPLETSGTGSLRITTYKFLFGCGGGIVEDAINKRSLLNEISRFLQCFLQFWILGSGQLSGFQRLDLPGGEPEPSNTTVATGYLDGRTGDFGTDIITLPEVVITARPSIIKNVPNVYTYSAGIVAILAIIAKLLFGSKASSYRRY